MISRYLLEKHNLVSKHDQLLSIRQHIRVEFQKSQELPIYFMCILSDLHYPRLLEMSVEF